VQRLNSGIEIAMFLSQTHKLRLEFAFFVRGHLCCGTGNRRIYD